MSETPHVASYPSQTSPYIVGIDLGTTHCAVASARPEAGVTVEDFPIPQLKQLGEVMALPLLP